MNKAKPIGIIDTGIGGLTTVTELQNILPGEDIFYIGDSARNPYGNRPPDEIIDMTCEMLGFLEKNEVKVVGVACNTISTFIDHYESRYGFPILGIVTPACEEISKWDLPSVGVFATVATIQNGTYQHLITQHNPKTKVVGQGSPRLGNLIDRGDFIQSEIDADIKEHVDKLLEMEPVKHIILGCTHYPIVRANFERLYPGIEFINPARTQAIAIRELLKSHDGLNEHKGGGEFIVCTTGDVNVYADVCKRLNCKTPDSIRFVELS